VIGEKPPHAPGGQPDCPGGGNILDITDRLPAWDIADLEPEFEPEPESVQPRWWLVVLMGILFGLMAGVWGGTRWQAGASRQAADQLMANLSQPSQLVVAWPEQENRSLRLMGLMKGAGAPLGLPEPLSAMEERMAEVWLLQAALERADPDALRALAAFHVTQGEQRHLTLLAKSELETYLAQHGPTVAVLNDVAVVAALLGNVDAAAQYLEQGLAMAPRQPVLLFNATQVARAAGPSASAIERAYLYRYLAIDQGSRWRAGMERRYEDVSNFRTRFKGEAQRGRSPGAPGSP